MVRLAFVPMLILLVPPAWALRVARGVVRTVTRIVANYLPGEEIVWDLGRGSLHIGIVGEVASEDGARHSIHDIGAGAREEQILFRYRMIGHCRPSASVATP